MLTLAMISITATIIAFLRAPMEAAPKLHLRRYFR